ncbi:hypothetical protein QUC32_09090 [Novosphingobium resinovorum]|jgi:acyl-CoA reductase-like NAD-dependent aldehyde dehydrogenase|uniref:hypothetical protein n=1 Tax=Novosphingobium TaxID=165696 RepID=UPI001B3C65A6|nr:MULTISPECIES: hypothetical protein [Novosphingobium]MBF7014234.1 hypothetical protein [Novosphingobium sp. HR1a]WJM25287.1 hypothetical protein QUC32_09090 [Novosphingobium resinovorum]
MSGILDLSENDYGVLRNGDDSLHQLERICALLVERFEYLTRATRQEMGSAVSFARTAQVPFSIAHVRTATNHHAMGETLFHLHRTN